MLPAHLPNEIALKMDDTILRYRYSALSLIRGDRCKKAWASCGSRGVNLGGTVLSADLGGSSNYSGENLEGRSGKWFCRKCNALQVTRS